MQAMYKLSNLTFLSVSWPCFVGQNLQPTYYCTAGSQYFDGCIKLAKYWHTGGKAQNPRPTALTPAREAGTWN